ncbi:hypothetical protein LTR50_002803 [Elasticomyces elasticus]|nr:hypothetical protein LTR50_002803 [Elasticomyces elasticus]
MAGTKRSKETLQAAPLSSSSANSYAKRPARPRQLRHVEDAIPSVFQELLSEAASSTAEISDEARPLKKRKTARNTNVAFAKRSNKPVTVTGTSPASSVKDFANNATSGQLQTVDESDESGESEFDFEDVDLEQQQQPVANTLEGEAAIVDISVDLSKQVKALAAGPNRRKTVSAVERKIRLEIHKLHVLCLLMHVFQRNAWCSSEAVHKKLRKFLDARTISYLNPDVTKSQFQRSTSFKDGLKQASDVWKAKFDVTSSGLRKPLWADTEEELKKYKQAPEDEPPIDKADFIKAAAVREGSQDIGAQLFCALLRAVGVEARLVCSLQPLSFAATTTKAVMPQKIKRTVYANENNAQAQASEEGDGSAKESAGEPMSGTLTKATATVRRNRIGRPRFGTDNRFDPGAPPPSSKKPKSIRKLTYPIYWVEAFDAAHQKWIPVDPLVTETVGKPAKFEPPASYALNDMSYVVGFEDDGVARDVTRRYAKAYNAKTRKVRVESIEGSERWWRRAMRMFRRSETLDRDQVEDAELAKKEATEGMPNNVQDFKDHPYYALERHLKRHEVIHPKREVGKVNTGKPSSSAVESVYRRGDVQIVKSADKWYRLGREIKPNEQPLKFVPARRQRVRSADADPEAEDQTGVGLYAASQTTLYIPPPVVNGRIPRNAYGNLDVYVPTMVPNGACHIRHPLTSRAARLISVDYADAVTGFQFKGRHGTAIVTGAVVADECRESIEAVIEAFEYEEQMQVEEARCKEALRMWKRFLTGLRIAERIGSRHGGDQSHASNVAARKQMDEADEEDPPEEYGGGGFFPADGLDDVAEPTVGLWANTTDRRAPRDTAIPQADHDHTSGSRLRRSPLQLRESRKDQKHLTTMPVPTRMRPQAIQATEPLRQTSQSATRSGTDSPTDGSDVGAVGTDRLEEMPTADGDMAGGFLPDDVDDVDQERNETYHTRSVDSSMLEAATRLAPGEELQADLGTGGGFIAEDLRMASDVADGGGFRVEEASSITENAIIETSDGLNAVEDGTAVANPKTNPNSSTPGSERLADNSDTHTNPTTHPTKVSVESLSSTHGAIDTSAPLPFEASASPGNRSTDSGDDDLDSLLSHDPEDEDADPEWLA